MTDLETIKALLEKAGCDITVTDYGPAWESQDQNNLSWTDQDITVDFGDIDIEFTFRKEDYQLTNVYVSDNRTPGY